MPDITNPQAIRFVNERARIVADNTEALYETLKRFQSEYAAVTGNNLFPDAADEIKDGAEQDGRKRVLASQIRAIKALADAMVTFMEAGNPPRINQVRAVSVHGSPKF